MLVAIKFGNLSCLATALLFFAAPSSAVELAASESISVSSVCEMAAWGEAMVGQHVKLKADYRSDFTHGAYLSDRECPTYSLPLGVNSPEADESSISRFDEMLADHRSYYFGRAFWIEATGVFRWDPGETINAELAPRKQLRIPPHGVFSIEKVWNFDKPAKHQKIRKKGSGLGAAGQGREF